MYICRILLIQLLGCHIEINAIVLLLNLWTIVQAYISHLAFSHVSKWHCCVRRHNSYLGFSRSKLHVSVCCLCVWGVQLMSEWMKRNEIKQNEINYNKKQWQVLCTAAWGRPTSDVDQFALQRGFQIIAEFRKFLPAVPRNLAGM